MSLEPSPARAGEHSARTFDDPILRPPAAAVYLGLSMSTLAKMRMQNVGPAFVKLTGRACGYRLTSLARYARENERQTTAA